MSGPVSSETITATQTIESSTLLASCRAHAESYMSQPHYDASHDWNHVLRVVSLAKHILKVESSMDPESSSATRPQYDPLKVELAALLHDVGDHKYAAPGSDPKTEAERLLLKFGADQNLAHTVQSIVNAVSFSYEVANPEIVRSVLVEHPELGIVQDADRLDAIGAVGIGRLFTFGGAKKRGLKNTIDHIDEKLLKLQGMMKTAEGRRLAAERTRRLKEFQAWWVEETGAVEI